MKQSIFRFLRVILTGVVVIITLTGLVFGQRNIPLDKLKEKYASPPSSFLRLDGMDVHYRDEGNPNDSLPLVLIHGTGSSLHTFNEWVAGLSPGRRVIRMDLPAYGLTGPFPDRDYSIENYTAFLYTFLAALDVKKCILGGNSLGGGIAWQFALEHPGMVDRLILINASGYPSSSTSTPLAFRLARIPVIKKIFTFITPRFIVRRSIENVYADDTKITNELVDRYYELSLRKGNRQAFIDRLGVKYSQEHHKLIPQIFQPTLILWGEKDELIPVSNALRFQADLPYNTLVVLKNSGHVPMEENPVESLEAVVNFVSQ